MRCLNESIARRANREDQCTGRFWEGRFKSQALLDEAALVTCMAYVDLNPIRAGIAQTPESSEFTSIAARIEDNKQASKTKSASWLLPFESDNKTPLAEVEAIEHLPISQEDYFELVDWTGRVIRDDKRGVIPAHIAPILQRLSIDESNWTDNIQYYGNRFYRVVGAIQKLVHECEHQGRCWLKGQNAVKMLYQ